jgi:perosamine synthetase
MVQTVSRLALEGGPQAVTLPPGDRWQSISDAEVDAVTETLRSGSIYAPTATFEREFAALVGTKHALAVCNGTASIHSALFPVGVRPGDEVIVPSYTWHASITPIMHRGAHRSFVKWTNIPSPPTPRISAGVLRRAPRQWW